MPSPVRIMGLRIGGEPQRISAVGETEVSAAELSADESNLQIEFVSPGFGVGEGVRYQYRLQGANQEWSPPGEGRAVNFASLAPGSYQFEVRAVNGDGAISPGVASFRFRVLPPLWQRWWFITLATLLVAGIAYQLYRYRVTRLVEMERVRTRIAADLHDDIGSSLSQVAVLSEVLRRKAGDDAQLTEPLLQIASVSREAVDSMSDIVWAINPAKDHLQDLVKRMRRHGSEVFPASHIEFQFDAPETAHEIALGADVRRQVFLIFKESVTNIIRHSHCDRAAIRLAVEGSQLVLEVTDNGKGFDPTQRSDGNGLVSMRRRASSLGGTLEVISASGTTIRLRVPYSSSRLRG